MKYRITVVMLAVSLLLTGCNWFSGSYVSITPYEQQKEYGQGEAISAKNYYQLRNALQELVSSGTESSVIHIADYDPEAVESNLEDVINFIKNVYPIGAYAVEDISYEVGIRGGKPAIALTITYNRTKSEIRRIQTMPNLGKAEAAIGEALKDFRTVLVLEVQNYRDTDFVQMVEDYVETYPEFVIEAPVVSVDIYGTGVSRVVELSFSYQNNRDALRQMKTQVQQIFDSAELYVSSGARDRQKYSQLYSFLMERFDYSLETSITPAYSLLCHGVGDSRAFALTYASMCRRVGLDCRIVTGTRDGEPWAWNIVMDNGYYYHVDLLRSSALGSYKEMVDREMAGYVWDYSAYPECVAPYAPPEESTLEKEIAEKVE